MEFSQLSRDQSNMACLNVSRGFPVIHFILTACWLRETVMMTSNDLSKTLYTLVFGLAAIAWPAGVMADNEHVVFTAGQSQPPWQLYLGSESNWMVPVWGEETTSHKSEVVVVRLSGEKENQLVQAEWNGGLGQIYWQQSVATDFTSLLEDGYSLSLVARIDHKPKKSVDLKMDCGYPCGGALNMTKLFKAVPEDQWFRMSFGLACFKEAGANLANIFSPMVIMTKGKFAISILEVGLLKNPPAESIVDCG